MIRIGLISNPNVLHLEAVITEFPPVGTPFLQTAATVPFFAPASHPFVQDLANNPSIAALRRPAAPMQFAQFVFTDLRIVPEPTSFVVGLCGLVAFASFARRQRQRERVA